MKKSVSLIFGVSIAIVALVLIALGMYNKPHVDVRTEKEAFRISAEEIIGQYMGDASVANEKYGGEIILLRGKFFKSTETKDGRHYVILKGKEGWIVSCEMEEQVHPSSYQPALNSPVEIKGICVGFDDLLGELQMKKCSIIGH